MYKASRAAIAAVILSLSAGAAYAAPAVASSDMACPMMHDNGVEAPFKLFQGLHSRLHLNADQEKQWQTALATMQQNRQARQQSHQQLREQLQAQQNQPILDLNALHTARQQAERQGTELREQTSAAWLTLYNALDDQQKTLVSTALKKRFAQMSKRHKNMKKHRQAQ